MELKNLRQIALETGLSINYTIKDKEISKIFKLLENKIGNIVLKGGTGINRVYLDENKRFSEDIDFDIYSSKEINELKEDLFLILKKELKDYKVESPRLMHTTIRYDVGYINEINQKDKIKLEFRYKNTKMPKVDKKIINFGFVSYKSSLYNIYALEELVLQKLSALIGRDDGKDIYDLYYLFNLDINKDILNSLIIKQNVDLIKISLNKLDLLLKNENKIKYFNNSTNHFIKKSIRNTMYSLIEDLIIKLKELIMK